MRSTVFSSLLAMALVMLQCFCGATPSGQSFQTGNICSTRPLVSDIQLTYKRDSFGVYVIHVDYMLGDQVLSDYDLTIGSTTFLKPLEEGQQYRWRYPFTPLISPYLAVPKFAYAYDVVPSVHCNHPASIYDGLVSKFGTNNKTASLVLLERNGMEFGIALLYSDGFNYFIPYFANSDNCTPNTSRPKTNNGNHFGQQENENGNGNGNGNDGNGHNEGEFY